MKLLPSVTSTSQSGSTWRSKIREIEVLEVSEFALFLTGMNDNAHRECFSTLKFLSRRHKFRIPFVHATSTMSEQEFWLLHEHFGTERFNLHPEREFPLQHPLSVSIRERIYIENADQCHSLLESDVEGYAGICLDLSHYESMRKLHPKAAANLAKMLTKFPIGANHISAVYKDSSAPRDEDCLSIHHLSELTTLDYVRGFSPLLFGEFMAIELENSITDQVQALKELTEIMISNSDIVDESQIERVAEGARSVLF